EHRQRCADVVLGHCPLCRHCGAGANLEGSPISSDRLHEPGCPALTLGESCKRAAEAILKRRPGAWHGRARRAIAHDPAIAVDRTQQPPEIAASFRVRNQGGRGRMARPNRITWLAVLDRSDDLLELLDRPLPTALREVGELADGFAEALVVLVGADVDQHL